MNTRKEITIEQHEITIVQRGTACAAPLAPQRGWCSACEQEVVLLTAEAAARLCGVSQREIFRRLERGELHFQEMADGGVLICPNSLRRGLPAPPDQDRSSE